MSASQWDMKEELVTISEEERDEIDHLDAKDEYERKTVSALMKIHEQMRGLYGDPIGAGRHRTVWVDGDGVWVYKVPCLHSPIEGIDANIDEISRVAFGKEEYTPERVEVRMEDIPVVKMEYVSCWRNYHSNASEMPRWVDWIDCRQVGYTKDGRLVAYDWGGY